MSNEQMICRHLQNSTETSCFHHSCRIKTTDENERENIQVHIHKMTQNVVPTSYNHRLAAFPSTHCDNCSLVNETSDSPGTASHVEQS
jgi:hypothetical protein